MNLKIIYINFKIYFIIIPKYINFKIYFIIILKFINLMKHNKIGGLKFSIFIKLKIFFKKERENNLRGQIDVKIFILV